MSVMTRAATAADVEAIAGIHVAGYELAFRGIVPDAIIDIRTPALRRRSWRERIAERRADDRVIVGTVDGVVRGFVSGRPATREEQGAGPAVGCWESLYVDPDIVGSDTGRALARALETAMSSAFRALGFTEAICFVMDGNDRGARFLTGRGWLHDDGATREVQGVLQHRLRRDLTREPAPRAEAAR